MAGAVIAKVRQYNIAVRTYIKPIASRGRVERVMTCPRLLMLLETRDEACDDAACKWPAPTEYKCVKQPAMLSTSVTFSYKNTVVAKLSENVYQQTMAGEVMVAITTNRHTRRGVE